MKDVPANAIITNMTGERWMAKNTTGDFRFVCYLCGGVGHLPGDHPTRGDVAQLAYHLYELRGRQDGHDFEDWLGAERELKQHYK